MRDIIDKAIALIIRVVSFLGGFVQTRLGFWLTVIVVVFIIYEIWEWMGNKQKEIRRNLDGVPVYNRKTKEWLLPFSQEQKMALDADIDRLDYESVEGIAYLDLPADIMREASYAGHWNCGPFDLWKLTRSKLTKGQFLQVRDALWNGVSFIDELDDVSAYSVDKLWLLAKGTEYGENYCKRVRKDSPREVWERIDKEIAEARNNYWGKPHIREILEAFDEYAHHGAPFSLKAMKLKHQGDLFEFVCTDSRELEQLYKDYSIPESERFICHFAGKFACNDMMGVLKLNKEVYGQAGAQAQIPTEYAPSALVNRTVVQPAVNQTINQTVTTAKGRKIEISTAQSAKQPAPDKSLVTVRGEVVKSKSEVIIANILDKYGIDYVYEKPLQLGDRVIKPDFTFVDSLTGHTWYWEHCGMMNNEQYAENWAKKKERYHAYGISEKNDIRYQDKLLVTFDELGGGLDSSIIDEMVGAIASHEMVQ